MFLRYLTQRYLRIVVYLIPLTILGICAASMLGQMHGGAVIQYGLAAPDDRVIYVGVDVGHNLRLTRTELLPAHLFSATDTASDERQVVSIQTGGNIDLYLDQAGASPRQLTRFTDFPAAGNERAARRANLYPSWSPDGIWIAFISSTVSGRLDLYAVHPDGSGLHHLGDRIRASAPYAPRWVTFESASPGLWMLACAAGVVLLAWLLRGYKSS